MYLLCILCDMQHFVPYTKVLLMPLLAWYYIEQHKPTSPLKIVLLALFFSWLGDTLLIFTSQNSGFFLAGLGSFFLAHCCYIYTFIKKGNLPQGDWVSYITILLGIINLVVMLVNLLPVLPAAMQLPVVGYGLILTILLASSLFLRKQLHQHWWTLVIGVLLFIASDSLIAFNRFLPEQISLLPNKSFLIMLTYIWAQYWIVKALIMQIKTPIRSEN